MICIGIALLFGCLNTLELARNELIPASKVIINASFGYFEISDVAILDFAIKMLPFVLFQFLAGVEIYRHFCVASAYYFSRCNDRLRWGLREIGNVAFMAALFSIAYLCSGLILARGIGKLVLDEGAVCILAWQFLVLTIWLTISAILINAIAIMSNSQVSFVAVMCVQVLLIVCFCFFGENAVFSIYSQENIEKNAMMLKFNPLSHLVLAWHSSKNEAVDAIIHFNYFEFSVWESLIYLLFLLVIVSIFVLMVIRKVQFISEKQEGK